MISTRSITGATGMDQVLNSLLSVQSPEKAMSEDRFDDATPRFNALQMGAARGHLESAAQGACQIEALLIYAPETIVRFKTKMLLSAVKSAANALGFDLVERGKPHLVSDNVTGFGR